MRGLRCEQSSRTWKKWLARSVGISEAEGQIIPETEKLLQGYPGFRFTKYIGGFKNLSNRERLLRLNAETLELGRLKSDLTLMYRTIYAYCGLKFESFFTLSDNSPR